jgi:hypothetical protein
LVNGSTLYAGGSFNSIGGVVRNNLASVDAETGTVTSWDPKSNRSVFAIAKGQNTIFVGGIFDRMGGGGPGGQDRHCLAAFDEASGELKPWDPGAEYWVNALAVAGNTVFAGGLFTVLAGTPRNNVAAIDAATGAATAWNPNADAEVSALALSGSDLYVGGRFGTIDGLARRSIAVVDTGSGHASNKWNAHGDRIVLTLLAGDKMLYAGGIFGSMGRLPTANVAAIQLEHVQLPKNPFGLENLIALAPISPNPVQHSATIHFETSRAVPVSLAIYDLQGRQVASILNHALSPPGFHTVSISADGLRPGCYLCRLRAENTTAVRRFVVLR